MKVTCKSVVAVCVAAAFFAGAAVAQKPEKPAKPAPEAKPQGEKPAPEKQGPPIEELIKKENERHEKRIAELDAKLEKSKDDKPAVEKIEKAKAEETRNHGVNIERLNKKLAGGEKGMKPGHDGEKEEMSEGMKKVRAEFEKSAKQLDEEEAAEMKKAEEEKDPAKAAQLKQEIRAKYKAKHEALHEQLKGAKKEAQREAKEAKKEGKKDEPKKDGGSDKP